MTFFGRYLEAVSPARIVWTNEEAGEAGAQLDDSRASLIER